VALVRPGPIQGGAVHPYLNRRQGKEPITYPKALDGALERTLGVPIFQEQCMQIAIVAAGFTPGEADGLRRAMAAWKRKGGLGTYERRLIDGMTERGYELAFAQAVFEQIKGFSSYGFPESHAASFALLVYASCWIKHHHPAEFLAAMLNSQPLGFYSPSQLVQDAKRHGVEVRRVDVMVSEWDCTLEQAADERLAVRLGLRLVSGLSKAVAERIGAARAGSCPAHTAEPALPGRWCGPPSRGAEGRGSKPACAGLDVPEEQGLWLRPSPSGAGGGFMDAEDLARRANLEQHDMKQLAAADALQSLSGHRRQQVWDAAALKSAPILLKDAPVEEDWLALKEAPEGEAIVWDYASLGLTLRRHPLALLRPQLTQRRFQTGEELKACPNGRPVRTCGIVTVRQQPGTAHGVVFVTLEDETGTVQVIIWRALRERFQQTLVRSRLLAVRGVWQREGDVGNLIAGHLEDLTPLLGRLATGSRDFH
jgi:error-prone DNA polymerase